MATTATAPSTAANGSASATVASSVVGARPQLKNTIIGSPNGGNTNRRLTQSPLERRNIAQKPWPTNTHQKPYNGSTNSVTSSSLTPSQVTAMRARNSTIPPGSESDTQDKHMHDRTLYLLGNFVTRAITVTLKTGARYTGILAGADTKTHDIGVAMKWVRLVRGPLGDNVDDKVEEGEYVGGGPEKTMVFEPRDLVDIFAEKVVLGEAEGPNYQNGIGTTSGFRTDVDISGNLALRERELHRWQPGESTTNIALDEATPGSQGQGWNQFEANERLFGLKSDFDEDIYTTKLDRAHPLYQQREAAAAKIAREIEGQSISANINPHLAEERNIKISDDVGVDEEDRYGAVQRVPVAGNAIQAQINSSRYTPPALRAPTGHPTVPGAPHDPAIIASQLVRPETLQQKQQVARPIPPQINLPQQQTSKSEDAPFKMKEKLPLPETIAPKRVQISGSSETLLTHTSDTPRLPEEVTRDFKQFVTAERERYKRKRADIVQRDRATKLEELKKFSLNFTLKTEVPQDLVPILAKDKQKQAEIIEKAKANVAKVISPTLGSTTHSTQPPTREPPPNSFAAKNPVEFQNIKQQLLSGFPTRQQQRPQLNQQHPGPLSARLHQIADARSRGQQIPARSPVPIAEVPQLIPTGPAATQVPMAPKSISPASMGLRMNAKALEFRPNPSAATFMPNFGGPSTTATPSPTGSTHTQPTPRVPSPSVFFGAKKAKLEQERKSIRSVFNPIKRMKAVHQNAAVQAEGHQKKSRGNSNDFIDPSFITVPTWPTTDENKDTKYLDMFVRTEFSVPSTMHSPQPPHIAPHQPQHQPLPSHIPHVNQPHVSHLSHHPHLPQHHLGIPPSHYEDQHLRQIPPSVMPSPSLHNATIAPYQQSPVPHHSQIGGPLYAAHPQSGVGQYGSGGPGGPQFVQGFYGGFRGAAGTGQMMVQGPHPIPYPAGGQFMPHPQMYSPQQLHAYPHNGAPPPPPPSSQGYPSPGRGAPMMIHQGSSQGTPTGPQMVPYAIQPGQVGSVYTGQGQQQLGMIRGQPLPPHQGGLPPPQYYHPSQGHYPPGNRGNIYVGHPQQQHQGQHPQPQPQVSMQQTTTDGTDGK